MCKSNKKGFTLIELLVVISVIGILAALALASFANSQKQARDVRRRSDLEQYRNAFEVFANANNGLYPSYILPRQISTWGCIGIGMTLGSCPEDPRNDQDPSILYLYSTDGSDGGTITGSKYVMWGELEDTSSTTYWVVCSNGRVGEAAGPATYTNGNCPL